MICKQCGKTFTEKYSKWSNGDFCCKHCAKVYASNYNKSVTNQKQSKAMIDLYKSKYYMNPLKCVICGETILYEKRSRMRAKTCSTHCRALLQMKTRRLRNSSLGGGYRLNGHRKSHKGWYKGIWCDSTYELAYVIYCLDHNIPIKRCEESFEYQLDGVTHHYHPDFVVNNEIVEIKGYDRGDVDIKRTSVGNHKYKILYRYDLIPIFEYVSKAYNKKYDKSGNNFFELYE